MIRFFLIFSFLLGFAWVDTVANQNSDHIIQEQSQNLISSSHTFPCGFETEEIEEDDESLYSESFFNSNVYFRFNLQSSSLFHPNRLFSLWRPPQNFS